MTLRRDHPAADQGRSPFAYLGTAVGDSRRRRVIVRGGHGGLADETDLDSKLSQVDVPGILAWGYYCLDGGTYYAWTDAVSEYSLPEGEWVLRYGGFIGGYFGPPDMGIPILCNGNYERLNMQPPAAAQMWQPATSYTSGDIVYDTIRYPDVYFTALNSGLSGESAPFLDHTPGAETVDNEVTWQASAYLHAPGDLSIGLYAMTLSGAITSGLLSALTAGWYRHIADSSQFYPFCGGGTLAVVLKHS